MENWNNKPLVLWNYFYYNKNIYFAYERILGKYFSTKNLIILKKNFL